MGATYNQTILGNATYDRPTSQLVVNMIAGRQTTIDRVMIVSTPLGRIQSDSIGRSSFLVSRKQVSMFKVSSWLL